MRCFKTTTISGINIAVDDKVVIIALGRYLENMLAEVTNTIF